MATSPTYEDRRETGVRLAVRAAVSLSVLGAVDLLVAHALPE